MLRYTTVSSTSLLFPSRYILKDSSKDSVFSFFSNIFILEYRVQLPSDLLILENCLYTLNRQLYESTSLNLLWSNTKILDLLYRVQIFLTYITQYSIIQDKQKAIYLSGPPLYFPSWAKINTQRSRFVCLDLVFLDQIF